MGGFPAFIILGLSTSYILLAEAASYLEAVFARHECYYNPFRQIRNQESQYPMRLTTLKQFVSQPLTPNDRHTLPLLSQTLACPAWSRLMEGTEEKKGHSGRVSNDHCILKSGLAMRLNRSTDIVLWTGNRVRVDRRERKERRERLSKLGRAPCEHAKERRRGWIGLAEQGWMQATPQGSPLTVMEQMIDDILLSLTSVD